MSIRLKLALSIFLVEFAFLVAHVARDLQNVRATHYGYVSRRADNVVRRLSEATVDQFKSGNRAALEDIARHLLQSSDVIYAIFEDPSGRVLAGTSKDPTALGMAVPGKSRSVLGSESRVTDPSGTLLGRIRVGYSTSEVDALVRQTRRDNFLLSLFALIVSAAVAYGLGAVLTRSIGGLVQATDRMSAGDLDVRVETKAKDEVGQLARALNSMAFQLKKAFDRIQFSEQQYRFLVDNADDAIFALDLHGRFTHLNPKAEEICGYTASELLRQPVNKVLSPRSRSQAIRRLEDLRSGRVVGPLTVEVTGRERSRIVEVNAVPIRQNDQVIGVQGIARDVTERQHQARMKEALFRISEAASRADRLEDLAAEAIQVLHDLLDVDRSAVFLKLEAATSLRLLAQRGWPDFGARLVDAIPQICDLIDKAGEDGAEFLEIADPEPDSGRRGRPRSFVVPLRIEDHLVGVIHAVGRRRAVISEDDRALFQVVASALATGLERKRLEEDTRRMHEQVLSTNARLQEIIEKLESTQQQLIQSEKLSAIGQLVSGVAHELNNPLTGVIGFAELLLEQDLDDEVAADIRRIHREACRCERIVRSLLTVARQSTPENVILSVNELLETVIELRRYHLKVENIALETELDPELPQVFGDPNQLQQVFLNLISNAAQAISITRQPGTVWVRTRRQGGTVRIEVEDDGPGIPQDHLTRVFDPFFTTKEVGEGTGLGLSISYSLIEAHGGRIWVESEVGKGSCFFVELPGRPAEEPELPDASSASTETVNQGATILVVDDEEVVLGFMQRLLRQEGHQVHVARNADEAIQLLAETPFDLVVSDVKMPGFDGEHLYEQVHARRPELSTRIVFMTGDTIGDVTREFLSQSQCPVLRKPFTAENVRQILHSVLQAPLAEVSHQ